MHALDMPGPVRLARNTLAVLALLVLGCGVLVVLGVVVIVAFDPSLGPNAWMSGIVFAAPVAVVWLLGAGVHAGAGFMLHRSRMAGRWLTVFVGAAWLFSPLFLLGAWLIWCMVGDRSTRTWWSRIRELSA